jgi:hypothetical protein
VSDLCHRARQAKSEVVAEILAVRLRLASVDAVRGRRDGGVRSHMRTGLYLQFPANRENYRELFEIGLPKRLLVRETPRAAATSVSVPYAK